MSDNSRGCLLTPTAAGRRPSQVRRATTLDHVLREILDTEAVDGSWLAKSSDYRPFAGDQWGTTRDARPAILSMRKHDHPDPDSLLTCVGANRHVLGVKCVAHRQLVLRRTRSFRHAVR